MPSPIYPPKPSMTSTRLEVFTPTRGTKIPSIPLSPTSNTNHCDITSKLDGKCLGEMVQVWKDIAASEVRINTLETLKSRKLGLREVEQYSLGLRYGLKSRKMQNGNSKPVEGVVEASMMVKIRDEKQNRRELEDKRL